MNNPDVVIVGAGFTGLTAAFELSKQGLKVHVLESDDVPGGLAGTFEFDDGVRVEKFYHHWFNNDKYVPELVKELGLEGRVIYLPTNTGMFLNGRIWRLSTPLDLLKFKALSFLDRIRLGFLVIKVRQIKDWKTIEHLTIREWLEPLCGETVFKLIWEPLINAKFSVYSEVVNAVWMWKKLVLRGSTRNSSGKEELAYFKGGFGQLANELVNAIKINGGLVSFGVEVNSINVEKELISCLETSKGQIHGDKFIFTPAFPIISRILQTQNNIDWIEKLSRIKYLGNICLVLRLRRSLSETYWLNVNDPGFPFVGVIEHTNFDSSENYNGSKIAYLSRYLSVEDPIWQFSDENYFEFAMDHLYRMFPLLDKSWVIDYKIWRSEYAQPITEKDYSKFVPGHDTIYNNAWICTMAQIYPEDRGTNYSIRDGKKLAKIILNKKNHDEKNKELFK